MNKDDLIKHLEKQIIELKHENKHLNYQLDAAYKHSTKYKYVTRKLA